MTRIIKKPDPYNTNNNWIIPDPRNWSQIHGIDPHYPPKPPDLRMNEEPDCEPSDQMYIYSWQNRTGPTEKQVYLSQIFKPSKVKDVPKVNWPVYRRYPSNYGAFKKIAKLIKRYKFSKALWEITRHFPIDNKYDCLARMEFARRFYVKGRFEEVRALLRPLPQTIACTTKYQHLSRDIWVAIFGEQYDY